MGGGAILTESVFNLHGVGQYAAQSIGALDVPPVLVIVMFGSFFVVLMSALTDIDPADSPLTVTLPGSPPKAATFRFTHWRAAAWSSIP